MAQRWLIFAAMTIWVWPRHPEINHAPSKKPPINTVPAAVPPILISGHSSAHHQLEEQLAEFTGRPRALLYSTGYMANMGTINALVGRHDLVLQDQLNHASLLDGGHLSRATSQRYKHADLDNLQQRLEQSTAARKLIVTDGVFSMDGDLAPLKELSAMAAKHNGWLMVDDAHGFGVLGEQGGGLVEELNLSHQQVPVLVGTLGKSFGTFGAFVAGSEALIESLIQFSRSYIYTTAMPPAIAAATLASLKILREETWRREKLIQPGRPVSSRCRADRCAVDGFINTDSAGGGQ